jgi:Protein of unknown function (DUF432)
LLRCLLIKVSCASFICFLIERTVLTKNSLLWGQHQIDTDVPQAWTIGPLRLWCKRVAKEIWVAFTHTEADAEEGDQPALLPENIDWSRWALAGEADEIRFVPLFPDRPVVVKPESAFRVTKEAQARIYVRVPLWVRVESAGDESVPLAEIPTAVLSNTWFGTFTSGELCYWISSGARMQIEPDHSRPYLAICPIQIINRAEEELHVEKFCLRVGRLSLFNHQGQLWADETRINFKGNHEASSIEVSGTAPPEADGAVLVSAPRETDTSGFAAKTFTTLKDLSGLGAFLK